MTLFKSSLAVFIVLVSFTAVQAQELVETFSPSQQQIDQVRLDKSDNVFLSRSETRETSWFVIPQATQNTPQTPKDAYVFPTKGERLDRFVKSAVGPFALLRSAASAGLEQWDNSPLEWGQGMEGYGKRFASNVGRNAIRQTVSYGLSEALRLDTGFRKSTRKGFWPRLSDALIQNVTSRTRSGKRVLSAPIFAGAYSSAIIAAETWYPERYSYKDGLRGGTYSIGAGFAINVMREFVFNW